MRKLFLKIMLWSLAAAAVLGAAAILTGRESTLQSVTWTTLVTAGAAALLMPNSMLVDRPNTRASGLLGMAIVLAEFFLANALIWDIAKMSGGSHAQEVTGLTMLFLAACG